MTERSYLWTTGGAGDGASTYTRADWAKIAKIIAACHDDEGVAPSWLNSLSGSVPGANTARIATGAALVDGKPYDSDANVDVNIPSAVGGGNTRIDRIVLRADWTAQTVRITRIAGTDAASPSPPAITQTPGTTYDVMLYQALVNTSGTVQLTDERTYAYVQTLGIAPKAVSDGRLQSDASDDNSRAVGTDHIKTGAVTTEKLANSAVTNDKIAAGTIQDGRLASNSVTAAKIVNGAVTESKIGTGAVTSDKLGSSAVTAGKIAAGGVSSTGNLADNIVDDSKVGNRVPQFYRRQGGSASDWSAAGNNNYTPGAVRMQAGVVSDTLPAGPTQDPIDITFPVAFSNVPLILAFLASGQPYAGVAISSPTASGCTLVVTRDNTGNNDTFIVHWLAIGSE